MKTKVNESRHKSNSTSISISTPLKHTDTRPIYLIWKRKKSMKSRHRKTFGQVHFLEARCQLHKYEKPQETILTNSFDSNLGTYQI